MSRLLVRAAEAWIRANDPGLEGVDSTSENQFLWDAERAYWQALDELRHTRVREVERSVRRRAEWLPEQAWVVYQLIDPTGRILYVGMSGRPRARIRQHLREMGERIERVDYQSFTSRTEAYDAETAMIRHLQPPMNIAKVPL